MGVVTFHRGGGEHLDLWLDWQWGGGEKRAKVKPEPWSAPILLRAFFKGNEVKSGMLPSVFSNSENQPGTYWTVFWTHNYQQFTNAINTASKIHVSQTKENVDLNGQKSENHVISAVILKYVVLENRFFSNKLEVGNRFANYSSKAFTCESCTDYFCMTLYRNNVSEERSQMRCDQAVLWTRRHVSQWQQTNAAVENS